MGHAVPAASAARRGGGGGGGASVARSTCADAGAAAVEVLAADVRAGVRWAMVCACNMNRSMSAHAALLAAGFAAGAVGSYGTSDAVRLPSPAGPVAFNFGVPYAAMQRHVEGRAVVNEDGVAVAPAPPGPVAAALRAFSTHMGLDYILGRNVRLKHAPEAWVALTDEEALAYDVVVCFDATVYATLVRDVQLRLYDRCDADDLPPALAAAAPNVCTAATTPAAAGGGAGHKPQPLDLPPLPPCPPAARVPRCAHSHARRDMAVLLMHTPDNVTHAATAAAQVASIATAVCNARAAALRAWVASVAAAEARGDATAPPPPTLPSVLQHCLRKWASAASAQQFSIAMTVLQHTMPPPPPPARRV